MSWPPGTLTEGVGGDEPLELTDKLRVAPKGEIGLDPLLESRKASLLEPGDLPLGERLVGEVGKRRATPEGKRRSQGLRSAGGVSLRKRTSSLLGQACEECGVELTRLDPHEVAGRTSEEEPAPGRAQRLAKLRHPRLEGVHPRLRRPFAPELVDEPICRNHFVRVQKQESKQSPLLRPGQAKRPTLVVDLERAQDPKLHPPSLSGRR